MTHQVTADILATQTVLMDVAEGGVEEVVKVIEAVGQGENAVTPLMTVAAIDPIETTRAEVTLALGVQLVAMMALIDPQVLLAGDS